MAVLRRTVNPFPCGKQWRFNSSLPHVAQSFCARQEQSGRCPVESKIMLAGTFFLPDKPQNEVRRDFENERRKPYQRRTYRKT